MTDPAPRVERGLYFDAWFPWQHNYHPSFPPRRLRMIEHLEEYRATMLVWAALGGGNISLPYLEEEAFGEVPPRYRVYGFVNDGEFIQECSKRGIKVFGVVFEHAWEYPVELNAEEDTVLALNETRGAGDVTGWLGMREFWQDRYPKLWSPRSKYFPEPVLNAQGEEVLDILEECAQRDIDGKPCHALWIECPDREHWNYMMDRNNPVWREYLKAIVRLQIDAGVAGIHFDEAEVPLTSLQYGGCFCDTCVRGFRAFVQELPQEDLPEDLRRGDLSEFHYGRYLLERGFDFRSGWATTPLFYDYARFQQLNIKRYFGELAEYAREYARSVGRDTGTRQLLQPVRALLQHRAVRRRDRHRDAEHALAIPRVVPVRGRVRWSQARRGRREPLRRRRDGDGRGAQARTHARSVPPVAVRSRGPRCEHERSLRFVDGERGRGRVLRPARPGHRGTSPSSPTTSA